MIIKRISNLTLFGATLMLCLGTQYLHASRINHEVGVAMNLKTAFDYGGDYRSLNFPYGIWAINGSSSQIQGSDFSEPLGVGADFKARYIYQNKFFVSLGFSYITSMSSSARFALRDPQTLNVITSGSDEIPTDGEIALTHSEIPLHGGLVITFWNDLRMYAGMGISYAQATRSVKLSSADITKLDFTVTSDFKGEALVYSGMIMGEYIMVGSAEDSTKIAMNVGVEITRGMTGAIVDSTEETTLPTGFAYMAKDAGKIDLSGYTFFAGATYYFLRQ